MLSTQPLICVSICERDWPSVARAVRDAGSGVGIVEIRLDCLAPDASKNLDELRKLISTSSQPIILTFRAVEQGGRSTVGVDERLQFWRSGGLQLPSKFVDLELDIAEQLSREGSSVDWSRVICSSHSNEQGPELLDAIYERLAATPRGC